jgi:hypothetical protein
VVLNPLQAGIIIRELGVKVFECVFIHFFIPFLHVLYHTFYMLSRDNYQISNQNWR